MQRYEVVTKWTIVLLMVEAHTAELRNFRLEIMDVEKRLDASQGHSDLHKEKEKIVEGIIKLFDAPEELFSKAQSIYGLVVALERAPVEIEDFRKAFAKIWDRLPEIGKIINNSGSDKKDFLLAIKKANDALGVLVIQLTARLNRERRQIEALAKSPPSALQATLANARIVALIGVVGGCILGGTAGVFKAWWVNSADNKSAILELRSEYRTRLDVIQAYAASSSDTNFVSNASRQALLKFFKGGYSNSTNAATEMDWTKIIRDLQIKYSKETKADDAAGAAAQIEAILEQAKPCTLDSIYTNVSELKAFAETNHF